MNINWRIVRNLLSLCEYHYRLGIYHGAMSGDIEEVSQCADRQDGYMTYQYLGGSVYESKNLRDFRIYTDMIIVECNKMVADHLATYLRVGTNMRMKKEILSTIDFHYRKGLKHGLQCKDRAEAKEYLRNVGKGFDHTHFKDQRKWTTYQYLDTVKQRINNMHFIRRESDNTSTLYTLSIRLGSLAAKEKERKHGGDN